MRDARRQFAVNKPAVIGAGVIGAMIITGLIFMVVAGIAGNSSIAVNGGVWLVLAAVFGLPFGYGCWCFWRPRKIRAERQLDMVTSTALEVRDMLKQAQAPAQPVQLVVHEGGKR